MLRCFSGKGTSDHIGQNQRDSVIRFQPGLSKSSLAVPEWILRSFCRWEFDLGVQQLLDRLNEEWNFM